MDNLVSLLRMLSASQVRRFRHTATMSSMSLMTGRVLVWVSISKMLQNMQQYLEREENRPSNQKEVDKMEKLTTRLEEMDMMDDDIRCAYLTELGLWMMECPELYMEDSYLKYPGWPLHDKAVHAQHGGEAGQDEEGKKRLANTSLLRNLIQFYIESIWAWLRGLLGGQSH